MPEVVPVILCGGKGSRLWPLSREDCPKQFADLGKGTTLFGEALERVRTIPEASAPIVISNEKYRSLLLREAGRHGQSCRMICEPEGKNTAPAIALAALAILEKHDGKEPLMLVLPSDQVMEKPDLFGAAVAKAGKSAAKGHIVTFGIAPAYPSSNFGYISRGEALDADTFLARSFVEKPEYAKAVRLLESGDNYWNAGIFLMLPSVYLEELEKYRPGMLEICRRAWRRRKMENGVEIPDGATFSQCENISVDYAVMERSAKVALMPLQLFWNDLGSWEGFFRGAAKDRRGNAAFGKAIFEDCSNCRVFSRDRLTALIGVDELITISTPDALLITKKGKEAQIKKLLHSLESESGQARGQDCRNLDNYEILAADALFQVGRLTMNSGESLSLEARADRHWLVLCGKAEVLYGNTERELFTENQYVHIPLTDSYIIKNVGEGPLALLEIRIRASKLRSEKYGDAPHADSLDVHGYKTSWLDE